MNEKMRLQIPAQQSMVLVARMALAGLCAQFGADLDTLDDIRTACDEACYCLMNQGKKAQKLEISCRSEEPKMRICFTAHREAGGEVSEAHDSEIARGILETLASEVTLQHDECGVYGIEMLVHLKVM